LIIVILFALSVVSKDGRDLLLLLLMLAAPVWIIITRRRMIRFRSVIQSLILALVAYLAGLPFLKGGYIDEPMYYILAIFVYPMYIAGGLLVDRSGLGGVQLWDKG